GVVEVLDESQREPGLLRGGPEALELRPVLEEDADVSVVVPRDHAALAHRSEEGAVVQPVPDAGRVEELDGCREGLDDQLAAAVRRGVTPAEVGRVALPGVRSARHGYELAAGGAYTRQGSLAPTPMKHPTNVTSVATSLLSSVSNSGDSRTSAFSTTSTMNWPSSP